MNPVEPGTQPTLKYIKSSDCAATAWHIGQRLSATVIDNPNSWEPVISIGDSLYRVKTNINLQIGTKLEVIVTGQQRIATLSAEFNAVQRAFNMPMQSSTSGVGERATPPTDLSHRLNLKFTEAIQKITTAHNDRNNLLHNTKSPKHWYINIDIARIQHPPLQLGQIIPAKVLHADDSRNAVIKILNQEITAYRHVPLHNGQNITFKVIEMVQIPRLAILSTGTQQTTAPPNPIQHFLHTALAQQRPFTDVIHTLISAQTQLNVSRLAASELSVRLQSQIQSFIDSLPTGKHLQDPQLLKQALINSGLFLENKLTDSMDRSININVDLKFKLLQLIQLLQQSKPMPATADFKNISAYTLPFLPTMPLPLIRRTDSTPLRFSSLEMLFGELLRQLTGAVSRLQATQLSNVAWQEEETTRNQTTELLIKHDDAIDVMPLRIEEHNHDNNPQSQQWSVWFAFNLAGAENIQIKVSLLSQTIAVSVWTLSARVKLFIEDNTGLLMKNFITSGIQCASIQCLLGTPPESAHQQCNPHHVIDTHA